jgi:probable rRNA maturation factor
MKTEIQNRSRTKLPTRFIRKWVKQVAKELRQRKILKGLAPQVTLVFISSPEMKIINSRYRGKQYATDILSFESVDPSNLGDLVIAATVVRKQAKEHGLTFQEELGYMILHGMLHLLGYDHERSAKEAKRMFKIQDDVFQQLCQTSSHVSSSRKRRSKKKSRKGT